MTAGRVVVGGWHSKLTGVFLYLYINVIKVLYLSPGDVDFYMNGGLRQPGCAFPDITEIKSLTDLAKFPVERMYLFSLIIPYYQI